MLNLGGNNVNRPSISGYGMSAGMKIGRQQGACGIKIPRRHKSLSFDIKDNDLVATVIPQIDSVRHSRPTVILVESCNISKRSSTVALTSTVRHIETERG